ncbi:MAG: WD40 repeat domain-containing protein [Treponema sp.]|jgi:hypothetical protein|nr:WD40 repeat domain-containing protein [Treponema sp.]
MSKKIKYLYVIIVVSIFVIYVFVAPRPIRTETILTPQWFISLESNYSIPKPLDASKNNALVPFRLGNRYGYVDAEGNFAINQAQRGYVSIASDYWAEYDAIPEGITVRNPANEVVVTIDDAHGYPLFLDKRLFLINSERTSLSVLDDSGQIVWTHDFSSLITTIDAANGFVIAGLLHGVVEILDSNGRRIFSFEPGGSRLAVITGCAISQDAMRIAIVSGIDPQRFLLLERYGDAGNIEYKTIYHQFLEEGTRQPVHVEFIDNDRRVAFERQGGLGLYDISARSSLKVPLEGQIIEIDKVGNERILFLLTAQNDNEKRLVAMRFPGELIFEAPFRSSNFFLRRQGSRIYIGGNMTLALFELEKK